MIKPWRKDEKITAVRLNEMVSQLNGMLRLALGPGLTGRFDGKTGLALALAAGLVEEAELVWLRAVHSPGGETGDALPSEITYDWGSARGALGSGETPIWRCVRNDECRIYPQLLVEPAWHVVLKAGEGVAERSSYLVCPGECPARAPCEDPGELRSPERDEELWGLMMAISARVVELSAVARAGVQAPAVGAGAASTSWWEWMRGWWR